MNYRHQFHAGNFADVWKHALLLPLIEAMQRKEKGFLFLDTHAGKGSYDLATTTRGDSLERRPEYPEGIGRVWNLPELPEALAAYVWRVKEFNAGRGGTPAAPRYYPGSPWLAASALRAQDRLAVCELHPEEHAELQREFAGERRVSVHPLDGYTAIRAMLPPIEKRALVLIDPPYEEQNEFSRLESAIAEALRRMPAVTLVVWYPITERAQAETFLSRYAEARPAPAITAELRVAGDASTQRLRGCGLLVVNPPWQIEAGLKPVVERLGSVLAQDTAARGELRWLVVEK